MLGNSIEIPGKECGNCSIMKAIFKYVIYKTGIPKN